MEPDTPTTSTTLRWLAIATGVAGLHVAVVHSLWDGTGPHHTEARPSATSSLLVAGMLLPPVQAVAPPSAPKRVRPITAPSPVAETSREAPSGVTTLPTSNTPTEDKPDAPPIEPDVLAAAPSPPAPEESTSSAPLPPTDAQWQYDVSGSSKGFSYQATATMRWRLAQQRYDVQLSLGAFLVGSRSQHSQGKVAPQGLQPERFVDKARRERQLNFDWATRSVQSPDQPGGRPVAEGTQDRLSVFMQLASLLAALTQAPHDGQTWKIPVAGFGATEDWVFRFEGVETLDLPAGPFQTWKLHYQTSTARGQSVELWFSPEFHHLPVRIRMSQENGDVVDQRLSHR